MWKCGKKLTARTLKYSHAAVCPANGNTPPAKSRKKDDLLGCNPSEHGVRHEAPDDVSQDVSVKKVRPKRSPKKKADAVAEPPPLRYIDQFNAIENCIPIPTTSFVVEESKEEPKEEEPKEEEPNEEPKEALLGCNPSEHGVRHEVTPKKNVKIVGLKECENAVRNL